MQHCYVNLHSVLIPSGGPSAISTWPYVASVRVMLCWFTSAVTCIVTCILICVCLCACMLSGVRGVGVLCLCLSVMLVLC